MKLAALLLFCSASIWAQTCTPLNVAAVVLQGQTWQPAIVNGIDNLSYSSVRFQWTSDAATHASNYQRVVYATAAQYAANGSHIIGANPYSIWIAGQSTVTSNSAVQGANVDAGATQFWTGTGTWTRVANAQTTRVQNVPITGLTSGQTHYYRVNCAVQQPTGSFYY